ncbi:15120_t:CDS:1 [Funneliformis mosseae]|uniref:15120_t:CDS:1 n=1 Tax=Funneliformis mosseae TaxID=27381 RepID=A0A9N9GQ90_FUNMO|nr:15120_t:CDS:1 [Funneliformis mosseae]
MKRDLNFILVFILLATLSMVNAIPLRLQKRSIPFGPCPPPRENYPSPPLISVEIANETISLGQTNVLVVSGTLFADITDSTQLIAHFADPKTNKYVGEINSSFICSGKGCPIKARTEFNSFISDFLAPYRLPDPYSIVVSVVDNLSVVLGCATALVDS